MTDSILAKDLNGLIKGLLFVAKWFGILLIIIPMFGYLFEYCIMKTTIIIKENLFKKILSLSLDNFEKKHSGDFMSRINNDVAVAEGAYSWQLMMLIMAFISGIGSAGVIFSVNKALFLYGLIIGLLHLTFNLTFVKPLKVVSNKIQSKLSEVVQRFSDIVSGAFVIRAFIIGEIIFQKFVQANMAVYKLSLKRVKYNAILAAYNYSAGWLIFFGQIVIGGYLVLKNKLTFGNLMISINVMRSLVWLFGSVGQFLTNLQSSLAGAQRIFEVLDIDEKHLDDTEIECDSLSMVTEINQNSSSTCMEFKEVSFSYSETKEVLNDITFTVPKCAKVAFVGESGGGKSTIFKLIMGFYKPQKGEILIFGRPISDYTVRELRSLFAYVPQDCYLFNGSIYENIRYGKLNATEKEVIEAAKKANIHDFIVSLPERYNAKVGDRGLTLSGGQRQRIAIARAILKDAPILLLDEPTSSLDSESESEVLKALSTLMEGKTTLIIAHRFSTIKDADIIYIIEDGKIVEKGKHDELLSLNGKYSNLYLKQFATKYSF
ncbi:ABC transporter ATP-binding protein [Caldicellulosiruptor hydrothermalis]|uniref:ABC transporter ATP-binding protein n=1 Tax=Caldicellulosiruptor hydrothermalis TaxID=413888 RepID=UPI001EE647C7|nr:ABC transporter ATP-binding protein [Caldicellulosiruptor hydrothermalis]